MSGLSPGWLLFDLLIIAILIPVVIMQRRESGATLAWIMVIILIPFLGLLAFWLFGTTRIRLRRRKRRDVEEQLAPALHKLHQPAENSIPEINLPPTLLQLAYKLDENGPVSANKVTLLRDGSTAFSALETAINQAQHHIHLVYYIWQPDSTGKQLRDALTAACQRGVEVRLLLDDVGSRSVSQPFFQTLLQAGGKVERFLRVNPLSRQISINNRNHRKIMVVDGIIGFTGGMNVGDDYAGRGEPWRDLHARICGSVVYSLQEVFCQDWYHASAEDLVSPVYFPAQKSEGKVWAQLLASGPADHRWRAIHTLLFAAINLSQTRVWIETPYFVPDTAIIMALQTAALRGVDVRLLLPAKSDHPLVQYAGRSFQDGLLAAGVRIYELQGVMPHAKTVTIDGVFSSLGSANMDQRSFRLNFEANLFFYGEQIAAELEQDFLSICEAVKEITASDRKKLSIIQRLAEAVSRVLAPLL